MKEQSISVIKMAQK